jgi:hypothetical protein
MAIPNRLPMINVLQGILIFSFLLVFYQDTKDRMVYWFLYPLCGIAAFIIQYKYVGMMTAIINSLINICFIAIILSTAFFYSKTVMKKPFINGSMGSGDVYLFLFLSFTFTTSAFILLFVFSLCFSLVLHLYLKNKTLHTTVPLAGYMSLFFSGVYIAGFFLEPKYLYS